MNATDGVLADNYLGEFERQNNSNGKPTFKNAHGKRLSWTYDLFNPDKKHWVVGFQGLESEVTDVYCPVDVTTWNYRGSDVQISVTCT